MMSIFDRNLIRPGFLSENLQLYLALASYSLTVFLKLATFATRRFLPDHVAIVIAHSNIIFDTAHLRLGAMCTLQIFVWQTMPFKLVEIGCKATLTMALALISEVVFRFRLGCSCFCKAVDLLNMRIAQNVFGQ